MTKLIDIWNVYQRKRGFQAHTLWWHEVDEHRQVGTRRTRKPLQLNLLPGSTCARYRQTVTVISLFLKWTRLALQSTTPCMEIQRRTSRPAATGWCYEILSWLAREFIVTREFVSLPCFLASRLNINIQFQRWHLTHFLFLRMGTLFSCSLVNFDIHLKDNVVTAAREALEYGGFVLFVYF